METAKRFYILSMMVITAKRRYGTVKPEGVLRVLETIKNMQNKGGRKQNEQKNDMR